MEEKLPPVQLELYKRVDEILYYVWDPIGVADESWCRDEYQDYLPQTFKLSLKNDVPEPIAEYLSLICVDRMGIAPNKNHDLKVAKLILEIREELKEKWCDT